MSSISSLATDLLFYYSWMYGRAIAYLWSPMCAMGAIPFEPTPHACTPVDGTSPPGMRCSLKDPQRGMSDTQHHSNTINSAPPSIQEMNCLSLVPRMQNTGLQFQWR